MIIGFTGTRQIDKISIKRIDDLLQTLLYYNTEYRGGALVVVHGCAIGAVIMFHKMCLNAEISIVGRPSYTKHSLVGFKHIHLPEQPLNRNKRIVDDCDILIALPIDVNKEELRSGTWSTIRYARSKGKKIIMI